MLHTKSFAEQGEKSEPTPISISVRAMRYFKIAVDNLCMLFSCCGLDFSFRYIQLLHRIILGIAITYFKTLFWPKLGVGASFQVIDILDYTCGLRSAPP